METLEKENLNFERRFRRDEGLFLLMCSAWVKDKRRVE